MEGERLRGVFSCELTVPFSEGGERGVAVDWVSSAILSELCTVHTSWSVEATVIKCHKTIITQNLTPN